MAMKRTSTWKGRSEKGGASEKLQPLITRSSTRKRVQDIDGIFEQPSTPTSRRSRKSQSQKDLKRREGHRLLRAKMLNPFTLDVAIDAEESEKKLDIVKMGLENLLFEHDFRDSRVMAAPLEVRTKDEAGISPGCLKMLEAAVVRARRKLNGAGVRLLRCIMKVVKVSHEDHIEWLLQRMILRHEQYNWMKASLIVDLPMGMESPRTAMHSQDRLALFERMHEEPNVGRHSHHIIRRAETESKTQKGEKAWHNQSWASLPEAHSLLDSSGTVSTGLLTSHFRRTSGEDMRSSVDCQGTCANTVTTMAAKARAYLGGTESCHMLRTDEVLPKPLEEDVPATFSGGSMARPSTSSGKLQGRLEPIAMFPPLPTLTDITRFTDKVQNDNPLAVASEPKLEIVVPQQRPSTQGSIGVERSYSGTVRPATADTLDLGMHDSTLALSLQRCSTAPGFSQVQPQVSLTKSSGALSKTAPAGIIGGTGKGRGGGTKKPIIVATDNRRPSSSSALRLSRRPSRASNSGKLGGDSMIVGCELSFKDLLDRHDKLTIQCLREPPQGSQQPTWLHGLDLLRPEKSGDGELQLERCRDRATLSGSALGFKAAQLSGVDKAFSEEIGYLQACAKRGLNPRLLKFLAMRTTKLDLADMCLGNKDLDAIVEALQAPKKSSASCHSGEGRPLISEINIMGNRRLTDAATAHFLSVAIAGHGAMGPCFGRVKALNLGKCAGLGERVIESLVNIFEDNRDFLQLEDLDITGIGVPPQLWPPLVQGLAYSPRLRRIILADTGCGRHSQESCAEVASLLTERRCKRLEQLDVSGNFFMHKGCKALSECLVSSTTSLRDLDMSHNAGFATAYSEETEDPSQKVASFNPIMHVLEVLGETSLKRIAFVNCGLAYAEDCIIEDVVSSSGITHLDVSDNPHGELGMRCLLRLLVNGHFSGSQLERLSLDSVRQYVADEDSLVYDYAHPSSSYKLQLEAPQHRSVLRMLLKRSEQTTRSAFQCFSSVSLDRKPVELESLCHKRLDRGGDDWRVPRRGALKFSFELPDFFHPLDELPDVLRKFSKTQKVFVRFTSFTRFIRLFECFRDQRSRDIFMDAMSIDLTFKLCQVNLLKTAFPEHSIAIVRALLPTVILDASKRAIVDLLDTCKVDCDPQLVRATRLESRSLLYMNTLHADGHYELDLENRMDRAAAERLIIVSRWQRARSLFNGCVDLSEFGNRECWRRTRFMKKSFQFNSQDWMLPQHGHLAFDFVLSEVVRKDASPPKLLEEIWRIVRESPCNFYDRIQALRAIAHRIILTPRQLAQALETFPIWDPVYGGKHELPELNVKPRAEVFILFYNRTRYHAELISPMLLYNGNLLHREEIEEVRSRLGWLHTFDVMNLHSEDSNLGTRHGPFDLTSYEGRTMVKLLLAVSFTEPSQNFFDNHYTPHQDMHDRGYPFVIPISWIPEPASVGAFTTTWQSRREEVSFSKRHQLSITMLGREYPPELKQGAVEKMLEKLRRGGRRMTKAVAIDGAS